MPLATAKHAPAPQTEATSLVADDVRARLRGALRDRYGDGIDVDGATGPRAAWLACTLPEGRRHHEMVLFARASTGADALDALVDYLDGLLAEVAGAGVAGKRGRARGTADGFFLPLDFEGRPYDGGFVFVRGEVRDFDAETQAARLLGEPPPMRWVRNG